MYIDADEGEVWIDASPLSEDCEARGAAPNDLDLAPSGTAGEAQTDSKSIDGHQ